MRSETNNNFFITIIKGVLSALITAFLSLLIFSAIIKFASLGGNVIKAVNQFLKVLAVFLGCTFSIKESMGFIKGVLIGGLSTLLICLIFAFIGGQQSLTSSLIVEVIFGVVVGAISGIVSVNLKK